VVITIGEVILLLLFSLLLVLAIPLIKETEKNKKLETKIEQTNASLRETKTEAASMKEIISKLEQVTPGKGIENITKEYVRMAKRIEIMRAQLKEFQNAASAFSYLIKEAQSNNNSVGDKSQMDVAKDLSEEIATNRKLRETVSEILSSELSDFQGSQLATALKELAKDALTGRLSGLNQKELVNRLAKRELKLKQAERKLENTKGQLENLKKKFSQGGHGVEAVPCWSTPEGNSENIFDIALTTYGFIIRDRKLAHRKDEQRKLPLADMQFGSELSPSLFLKLAKPIFDWSVKHECRFFVRVFDNTSSTEKLNYKHHLRFLGDRFYHYEELNERF